MMIFFLNSIQFNANEPVKFHLKHLKNLFDIMIGNLWVFLDSHALWLYQMEDGSILMTTLKRFFDTLYLKTSTGSPSCLKVGGNSPKAPPCEKTCTNSSAISSPFILLKVLKHLPKNLIRLPKAKVFKENLLKWKKKREEHSKIYLFTLPLFSKNHLIKRYSINLQHLRHRLCLSE